MTALLPTRILLILAIGASAVGVIDAVDDEAWDHLALFGVALVATVALFTRTLVGRQLVRLRHDHLLWLSRRSQLTGEPVQHIADRALAAYRATLDPAATAGTGTGTEA